MRLCNREAVELTIDGGSTLIVEAGKPPVIDGKEEYRMRVGCGSATIGMFASQWKGLVDEVVVVDDHITGVVSEHQAGKVLGWENTGIKILGHGKRSGFCLIPYQYRLSFSNPINAGIMHGAIHPGADLAASLKGMHAFKELQKGILHNIFRLFFIAMPLQIMVGLLVL